MGSEVLRLPRFCASGLSYRRNFGSRRSRLILTRRRRRTREGSVRCNPVDGPSCGSVVWRTKDGGKLNCFGRSAPAVRLDFQTSAHGGGQTREAAVEARCRVTTLRFGSFEIAEPGYQRFVLASLNKPGQPNGDLERSSLPAPPPKTPIQFACPGGTPRRSSLLSRGKGDRSRGVLL